MRATLTMLFIQMTVAGIAAAGVPDLQNSTAWTAAPPGSQPVLCNAPDGNGSPFAMARTLNGLVDATITIELRDGANAPVAYFSAFDLWLETDGPEATFMACASGTSADRNTDLSGRSVWAAPLWAGGWSTGRTRVMINGAALTSNAGLEIRHNSPDLNGDRVVDLSDVAAFATDYFGADAFRSDLWYDGVVDLADIPLLARAFGALCP